MSNNTLESQPNTSKATPWRLDQKTKEGPYSTPERRPAPHLWRSEVLATIDTKIEELDEALREVSLDMCDHPELSFKEHRAHDNLTAFIGKHAPEFTVTQHYLLETGWRATFQHGEGGPVIGVNSEMDALPGIGHACGHNLIAIAGITVAVAIAHALKTHDIPGTVILLGTPAEEGGEGKVHMLKQGAYEPMDACLMCHPGPGLKHAVRLKSSLAIQTINVEYKGHSAHAALSPWEGTNALDACVLAYNGISALRQQIRPSHRVHGVFKGNDWAPNIIPDNSQMTWLIRAPTWAEVQSTSERVVACFKAAALATGCEVKIDFIGGMYEVRQNTVLGPEFAKIIVDHYGGILNPDQNLIFASTDFGNISYELPSLHPFYAVPTSENGGNHTPGFEQAARTHAAHKFTLTVAGGLAALGVRMCDDKEFLQQVKDAFEEDKALRSNI